jgi:peptidoglycan hydrolase-like protein with peptidoglycan-binding domain
MKKGLMIVTAVLLGGCSSLPSQQYGEDTALRPQLADPQRNVTGFGDAISCMDKTFLQYGVRDVSVIMEDLSDSTKKVNAGTRDMMVSAISDMTRRSRAIQLITFGQDANNIVAFLNAAQQRGAFAVVPQFSVRGSVSQLDEGVLKKQRDGGFSFDSLLSLGASTSVQYSVLGLDLSMVQTSNLALISGVTSKNAMTITKSGDAIDAEATIKKIGINFSTSVQSTQGTAQGLRNMVELASVELFGKLLKLPYWSCMGVTQENIEVRRELEDWYISMETNGELIAYLQEQLRNRGFYDGPVDSQMNRPLSQAISAYQRALGQAETGQPDQSFFNGVMQLPFPAKPERPFREEPITLTQNKNSLKIVPSKKSYKNGEAVSIELRTTVPAYAYCYHENSAGKVNRIFPNRFQRDPRISAKKPLKLPAKGSFQLNASNAGQETIACFAAPRELYNNVPAALRWGDFQTLNKVNGLDGVRDLLAKINNGEVAEARFSYVGQGK